jgi:hypothetical protein
MVGLHGAIASPSTAPWGSRGDTIGSVLVRYAEAAGSHFWHRSLTGPWRRPVIDVLDVRGLVLRRRPAAGSR